MPTVCVRRGAALALGILGTTLSGAPAQIAPPATERRPVAETLHGTELVDPYRWLEGDNSDPERIGLMNEEVASWTDGQNAFTRDVLDSLPGRATLEARMRELMEVGTVGLPSTAGDRTFFRKREGAQAQSVLFVVDEEGDDPRPLIDPFAIDPSGLTSLDWYAPNSDGSLVAFGTSRAGDENSTLNILETDSGEWLADEIPGKVGFSGWMPDGQSFFYTRLEDVNDAYSRESRFHEVGRSWRRDPVIWRQREIEALYEGHDKTDAEIAELKTTWAGSSYPSEDGRWLIISYASGTSSNDVWIADLDHWLRTGELAKKPVVVGEEGRNSVAAYGDMAFLRTNIGAPNGRIVAIDPASPGRESWRDVVAHRDDVVVTGMQLARGLLVASLMKDAASAYELFTTRGEPRGELRLPGIGSAGLSANSDRTSAYLSYSSYNAPSSIYRVDLATPRAMPEQWFRVDVPVDESEIVVNRVSYTSKDGTEVGMFIVHKEGLELDGDNPTLLYGYGGFNISMRPGFSATLYPWLEAGGVYAVANLRGGGEKGLAWHKAGQLDQKQNVFDDFIAAGEYLVSNGYTRPEKLAVRGGSNGGLLTGAMVTQRPDLFAAAIVAVPLLDMVRYQDFLMARFWIPEYGSAENAEQFEFIRAYSPYHNIQPGTKYPAVLLTAGENDARVHPMHARKMAAALQAATTADPEQDPVLLWVDRDAGHGSGKPLDLRVRDAVDQYLFVMWQTGLLEG